MNLKTPEQIVREQNLTATHPPEYTLNKRDAVVIYHGPKCLDGFGAAWAAWTKLGWMAWYLPYEYGMEPPDVTGLNVYILDFSFPRDVLEDMAAKAKSILVLDHHKTAQEALEGLPYAQFDMDRSGAMMTWCHFHQQSPAPATLQCIQDRDLWLKRLSHTEEVTTALFNFVPKTFEAYSHVMTENGYWSLIEKGKSALQIRDSYVADRVKECHAVTLQGHEGLVVNSAIHASEIGNALAKQSGTFGMIWWFDGSDMKVHVSLRSIGDFDVSELAKRNGGGGHKNAAGYIAAPKDFFTALANVYAGQWTVQHVVYGQGTPVIGE